MLEKLLLRARAGHSAGGTDGRLWDAVTLALQMSVCSIGQIDLQSNLVQKLQLELSGWRPSHQLRPRCSN